MFVCNFVFGLFGFDGGGGVSIEEWVLFGFWLFEVVLIFFEFVGGCVIW